MMELSKDWTRVAGIVLVSIPLKWYSQVNNKKEGGGGESEKDYIRLFF